MQCITTKSGVECAFMTRKGCTFNGGRCHPVVESCNGCTKTKNFDEGVYCLVAPDPAAKWVRGKCNFATHLQTATEEVNGRKLNPLKASKRAASGRS